MALRLFKLTERPAAMLWSAAGGFALVIDPFASDDIAPWLRGVPGEIRGELYGCDLHNFRILYRAAGSRRFCPKEPGTVACRVSVTGWTLRNLVLRCLSGEVESDPNWCRYKSAGKLWCGITSRRGASLSRDDLADWEGGRDLQFHKDHAFAFYASLPGGNLKWEFATVGGELLRASYAGYGQVFAGKSDPGCAYLVGSEGLIGFAMTRQEDLMSLIGYGVLTGAGLASRSANWIQRLIHPASSRAQLDRQLMRWGMRATEADYKRVGL